MKTTELLAMSLVGLTLLFGCNKQEEATKNTAQQTTTGSATEAPPAAQAVEKAIDSGTTAVKDATEAGVAIVDETKATTDSAVDATTSTSEAVQEVKSEAAKTADAAAEAAKNAEKAIITEVDKAKDTTKEALGVSK
jgi:hypothetical protein